MQQQAEKSSCHLTTNLQIHTKKQAPGGKDVADHPKSPSAWKGESYAPGEEVHLHTARWEQRWYRVTLQAFLSPCIVLLFLSVLFLHAGAAATKHADLSGHAACFARRDPRRWLAKETLAEESQVAHSAV